MAEGGFPVSAFPSVDVHVHLHPEGLARAIERWFADHGSAGHSFEPSAVADTLRARECAASASSPMPTSPACRER